MPEEIPALLEPVLRGDAEVVYGTRSFGSNTAYSFWYVLGYGGCGRARRRRERWLAVGTGAGLLQE